LQVHEEIFEIFKIAAAPPKKQVEVKVERVDESNPT
jgi:hypothetical protein